MNQFQGLQFRIMETLEKQPGQAPLTALEIAERLHSTVYRSEMKDNVVFKVSQSVHAMKNQGKIVQADARDKDGRLCYQLPTRMAFPKKPEDEKPLNPVLTPEIAAKVKTVEPEVETKEPTHKVYAHGIQDAIVEALNEAPHPLIVKDIVDKTRHLYPPEFSFDRVASLIGGQMSYLAKEARRVFRRRVTGYGIGVRYEYFTRKTGTEPHPLSLKEEPKAAAKKVPASLDAVISNTMVTEPLQPQPAPQRASGGGFRPVAIQHKTAVVSFRMPAEKYERVKVAAERFGVSLSDFCEQAIDFALANAE